MLDVLNALYLGFHVLVQPIYVHSITPVPAPQELGQVAYVKTAPWKDCIYQGLWVPYERTWPEVRTTSWGEEEAPPEPGKIAGYVMLFNKQECEGKPAEFVSYAWHLNISGPAKRGLPPGLNVRAYPVTPESKENYQKWVPQVLDTIQKAAATNPAAKDFIDFSMQAAARTRTTTNQTTE